MPGMNITRATTFLAATVLVFILSSPAEAMGRRRELTPGYNHKVMSCEQRSGNASPWLRFEAVFSHPEQAELSWSGYPTRADYLAGHAPEAAYSGHAGQSNLVDTAGGRTFAQWGHGSVAQARLRRSERDGSVFSGDISVLGGRRISVFCTIK